ncbi:MAG: hypothetical protein IJM55_05740 [Ruminococcus sp.]|jgi:hypothetical protein|nr:hypothetical protein [Ruminococcus sp.]
MPTNNENGRKICLIMGAYLLIKSVLNMIIGGGLNIPELLLAAIIAGAMYTGLKYVNLASAALLVIVVLSHIGYNLSNLPDTALYLIEGALDIGCAAVLVLYSDVKEHFTNEWGAR